MELAPETTLVSTFRIYHREQHEIPIEIKYSIISSSSAQNLILMLLE